VTETDTRLRLTDRERLVIALDELATAHGYLTANTADLHCCGTCLTAWLDEEEAHRAVGWHIQADEAAFGHGLPAIDWGDDEFRRPGIPICDRCTELHHQGEDIERADGCPDCHQEAWRAAEYDHILTDHHRLVGTLSLLVRGDRPLVVAVLRRHGLRADPAPYDEWVHVTATEAQP
jgi:hypothetical protein